MYKALVFDFFGVLCTDISTFWFEKHFAEKGKELRDHYLWPADRGTISQEQLFKELSHMAGVTPADIEKDWTSHITFNSDLIDYIRELKGKYRIGLISNATSPFIHTMLALSGASDLFDVAIISSEVGYNKPEPQVYEAALNQLGVEPRDALMIDDSQANVDGALQAGMAGVRYTSVGDLKKFLSQA